MASLQSAGFILPALQPPPGVTPHLVITGNPTKTALILVTVCVPTATAFVWARMYTKMRLIKSHGWEDYTSIIAWIGLIICSAFRIKSMECGAGIHQWNLPIQRIEGLAYSNNITEIIYSPTMLITKLSILLMFSRLFMPNRQTRHLNQFIIWFNVLFYLSVLIPSIIGCIPRRKIWQRWTPGTCVNEPALWLITAVINLLSDLSIILLPIGCVCRLQLSLKRKLAISAVFATGSAACIASVVRVVMSIKNYHSKDLTYNIGSQGDWAYCEVAIGIVCGCMPVLPQLFRHLVPKVTKRISKAQEFLSRFIPFSRIPVSSTIPPQDSEGGSGVVREAKKGKRFLTLRSFGENSLGLSTMIRAVLPSAVTSTSLCHEKKGTSGDYMNLESQKGITNTNDTETSISTQMNS